MENDRFEKALGEMKLAEYERADYSVGLQEGYSLGLSPNAYETIIEVLQRASQAIDGNIAATLPPVDAQCHHCGQSERDKGRIPATIFVTPWNAEDKRNMWDTTDAWGGEKYVRAPEKIEGLGNSLTIWDRGWAEPDEMHKHIDNFVKAARAWHELTEGK